MYTTTTLVQPPLQRFGLVPTGLRLKSPQHTQEGIQIVRATCRRFRIRARINDCHRRLNHYNGKLEQRLDKLKQTIPTNLLDIVRNIADRRANKTAEQCRTATPLKLTRLQRTKDQNRHKTDAKWRSLRKDSSLPLFDAVLSPFLSSLW